MTQINADLKLVVPVKLDAEGEPVIYAYHNPIPREVYEVNFRLLRDTKVSLIGTSPRHAFAARGDASLYLREAGAAMAADRGLEGDGGASTLLAEIKRLTTVLAPGAQGWQMLPIDTAIQAGAIDADDWSDAENAIVFFTAWTAGTPRREAPAAAMLAASLMDGSTTSLPPMEWAASLQTSTQAAISGGVAASSVPS